MTGTHNNRICFVLVPGTDPNRFLNWWPSYRPNVWFSEGSQIRKGIESAYPRAQIVEFDWSRTNTQEARNIAALNLSSRINELRLAFDRIIIVAHSHGGNVAVQATQRVPGDDLYLVTLGTPFVELLSDRSVARIGILFVLLYSIPLIGSALSFGYFLITGAVDKAATSAMWLLALAVAFYFLVLKVEIHKIVDSWLEEAEARIRASFADLTYRHPIKSLVIYYNTDAILAVSGWSHQSTDRLGAWSQWAHGRMEFLFPKWNPLYIGVVLLLFTFLWLLNIYWFQSTAINIMLAIAGTIGIAYLMLGLTLIAVPSGAIFANEAYKFSLFGHSLSSFSPIENLLVSARTRVVPILQNSKLSVWIEARKVSNPDRSHHSYITVDPEISQLIVSWTRSLI